MSFIIHQGQTLVRVWVRTRFTLTGATELKVLYEKPSGQTGEWTGSISGDKLIFYSTDSTEIDESGYWIFQAKATIDGEIIYGDSQRKHITLKDPIA